jgi:hypothetical protein
LTLPRASCLLARTNLNGSPPASSGPVPARHPDRGSLPVRILATVSPRVTLTRVIL